MTSPESSPNVERKMRTVHRRRVGRLIRLGILDLNFQYGHYSHIDGDGTGMNLDFKGETVVRIESIRNKIGEDFGYSELVQMIYDGSYLTIRGVRPVFVGKIPRDEAKREEIIGQALKNAWEDPFRKVIVNPRTLY